MNGPVVELKQAGKTYHAAGRGIVGVMDVDLTVEGGKLILLLGPSGSGKTTLLTLMAGLVAPSAGSVSIGGRRLERLSLVELQRMRARNVGVVFSGVQSHRCAYGTGKRRAGSPVRRNLAQRLDCRRADDPCQDRDRAPWLAAHLPAQPGGKTARGDRPGHRQQPVPPSGR